MPAASPGFAAGMFTFWQNEKPADAAQAVDQQVFAAYVSQEALAKAFGFAERGKLHCAERCGIIDNRIFIYFKILSRSVYDRPQ